jgi:hypothetical protein
MKDKIINFIKENIKDNNEIHISYEFSKIIEKWDNFKPINKKIDQNIIGDYNFGYLILDKKTYPIFSNILYEFDEIEFKK